MVLFGVVQYIVVNGDGACLNYINMTSKIEQFHAATELIRYIAAIILF